MLSVFIYLELDRSFPLFLFSLNYWFNSSSDKPLTSLSKITPKLKISHFSKSIYESFSNYFLRINSGESYSEDYYLSHIIYWALVDKQWSKFVNFHYLFTLSTILVGFRSKWCKWHSSDRNVSKSIYSKRKLKICISIHDFLFLYRNVFKSYI